VTDVRFVVGCEARGVVDSLGDYGEPYPALLVSYAYIKPFFKIKDQLYYRDWALDSGAYTAFTCGKTISLQGYIDFCKQQKSTDPSLSEIIALDVIGDWKASLRNYEEMWKQGIEAVPTYHMGEPTHVLKTLVANYPKVGISGYTLIVSQAKKRAYTDAIFSIAWPKKLHALGLCTEPIVKDYPWHSIDASSWCLKPAAFGTFTAYGKQNIGLTNNIQRNLRSEIEYFMAWEKHNKQVWRKELESLEEDNA